MKIRLILSLIFVSGSLLHGSAASDVKPDVKKEAEANIIITPEDLGLDPYLDIYLLFLNHQKTLLEKIKSMDLSDKRVFYKAKNYAKPGHLIITDALRRHAFDVVEVLLDSNMDIRGLIGELLARIIRLYQLSEDRKNFLDIVEVKKRLISKVIQNALAQGETADAIKREYEDFVVKYINGQWRLPINEAYLKEVKELEDYYKKLLEQKPVSPPGGPLID